MGKVMRHTLGASLNIRHNLSSSKGPKPLQLKLLTTYIPKRSEERFSRNAETDLVCRLLLEKKKMARKICKRILAATSPRVTPSGSGPDASCELVVWFGMELNWYIRR